MRGALIGLLWRLHRHAIDARRQHRTSAYLAWSLISAVAAALLILTVISFVIIAVQFDLWWIGAFLVGLTTLPIGGSWLVRHVLVPTSAYRLAYYVGRLSSPGIDPPAYGLCAAAWALGSAPSGQGELWITNRRDLRLPLGDAEVVTTALLAAARGDLDTARSLMRSVLMLVEHHPAVRDLAGEWLAVDAAERGAWAELAAAATAARWPATPLTYLLEGIAARHVGGAPDAADLEMWSRWLLAPHRRVTLPLVRAALRTAPPGEDAAPPRPATAAGIAPDAPLPAAIAAHLALDHAGDHPPGLPSAAAFAAAVTAWDAALAEPPTRAWLDRRALELDAPAGAVDRVIRDVAAGITDELTRIAEVARLGAPSAHGLVGGALAHRLRHGRLDALEQAFTRWTQRRRDGTIHVAIDEWREFVALHDAYAAAAAAGGTDLRRLAFPHAYATGNEMAVWLWNTRKEHAISHAISVWLRDEALAVGDAEAIEVGNRNCGLHVPTRTPSPSP